MRRPACPIRPRSPRAEGASARHRSRTAAASPAASWATRVFSAARASASTGQISGVLPSSVSTDVARSASSGGNAADRRLIPNPSITCCNPSAPVDASARTPASFRRRGRRSGFDDDVVRPLDVDRQPGGRANAVGHSDSAGERQQRRRRRAPADHGHVETGARRRKPLPPEPAASRRLRAGDNGRAFGRTALRQRGGDVVGRPGFGEEVERLAERAASEPRATRAQPPVPAVAVQTSGCAAAPAGPAGSGSSSKLKSTAGGRMRQRADRHEVGARRSEFRDPIQRHAARQLDLRAARDPADGLADLARSTGCRAG